MAKLGEGDPRWVVENRNDGKNVNKWHWHELDYADKGRDALKEIFRNLPIDVPQLKRLFIEKVDTCKGEMTLANRKGKIIFFHDFNLKLDWAATLLDDSAAKGSLDLTDITAFDDFDTKVIITDENSSTAFLRDIFKSIAIPFIKEKLKKWTEEMRDSGPYVAGTPGVKPEALPAAASSSSSSSPAVSPAEQPRHETTKPVSKVKCASFKSKIQFAAPPHIVFETLLDAPRVSAFTQSPAEIKAARGAEFKLFSGSISGQITELETAKKLSQTWRSKDWPAEHFSQVSMSFEPHEGSNCIITLTHSNVPESDLERTRSGWEQFFWQRIRGVFGWQYTVTPL